MNILDGIISDKRFRIFKTILEMDISKQRVIMILKQRFNELSYNNTNLFLFDKCGKPLIMFFKYNNKSYSKFFRVGKQVSEDIIEISKNGKWFNVPSFAGKVRYTPQFAATVEKTITPDNYFSGDFQAGVYDGIKSYIDNEEYVISSVVSPYNIGYKLGFRVAAKIDTSVNGELIYGLCAGYKASLSGEGYMLSTQVSKYNTGFKYGYEYGLSNSVESDEYDTGFSDGFSDGVSNIPKADLTDKSEEYQDGYNDGYKFGKDVSDPFNQAAGSSRNRYDDELVVLSTSETDYEQGNQDGYEDGASGEEMKDISKYSQEYKDGYNDGYEQGRYSYYLYLEDEDANDQNARYTAEYFEGYNQGYEDQKLGTVTVLKKPETDYEYGYNDGYKDAAKNKPNKLGEYNSNVTVTESIEYSDEYIRGYNDGYYAGSNGYNHAILTTAMTDYNIGYNDGYTDGDLGNSNKFDTYESYDIQEYQENYKMGYNDGYFGNQYKQTIVEAPGYSKGYDDGYDDKKSGNVNKYSADRAQVI